METTLNKLSNFHLTEKRKEEIFNLITILCCFLFLYAGMIKLWNLEKITQFQNNLENFPLIGGFNKILSYAIPTCEYVICLLLITNQTSKTGLQLFTGLIAIFTLYILYLFIRSGDLPCPCTGPFEDLSWQQQAGINILLLCTAQVGIRLKPHEQRDGNTRLND